MDAGTLELVELEANLDFPVSCDGVEHSIGRNGHDASQPASWAVHYPCGDFDLRCDAWVKDVVEVIYGCPCGVSHPWTELRFQNINV